MSTGRIILFQIYYINLNAVLVANVLPSFKKKEGKKKDVMFDFPSIVMITYYKNYMIINSNDLLYISSLA